MELETPFPYQLVGAEFLSKRDNALLADEMGLGKSCQAVVACDLIGANRILVICPANARINWQREFSRFSPFDRLATVVDSGIAPIPAKGVVIVSYDIFSVPKQRKKLREIEWDAAVLDECHYLKNRESGRTKAIYGADTAGGIKSKRTWLLSGTPAPNDISELWTHLRHAGVIQQAYWKFVEIYCTGFDTAYGFTITGTKNAPVLKKLLAKFMLRRKKDDVMKDLPPITFQDVTIERSPVDLDPYFYENVKSEGGVEEFLTKLKNADTALRQGIENIRLHPKASLGDVCKLLESMETSQITLRRYIGMAKVPIFCEIIKQELDENPAMKIVIFAVHKDVIETIRATLAKYGAVTLYGGTPAEKRQHNIDKFQNNPKCRVFIGNVKAAGTAITLTASCEVAFIEASWVPGDNAQASMRCHRIGQEKPVRVRFFACAGSVDEQVMYALRRKSHELAKIF